MITHSPAETQEIGRLLSRLLKGHENLCLVGELGSGKTAFVQGLARGLGVQEAVKSPTYTFLREYDLPRRSTRLAHFDLYRLPETPTVRELHAVELPERLLDADIITAIEWGDRLTSHDLAKRFVIRFEALDDTKRKIHLPHPLHRLEPR